jgi:uncharacterized damage-inducible protein DinB
MSDDASLLDVFTGWEGYNTSLIRALQQTPPELLRHPGAENSRTLGELYLHIAMGHIDWFNRMNAPGADIMMQEAESEVGKNAAAVAATDPRILEHWLMRSWELIESCLRRWSVSHLPETYLQPYLGQSYVVPRQWVIFRILAHDIHHGGQISMLLYQHGIEPPELGANGGHITPLRTQD